MCCNGYTREAQRLQPFHADVVNVQEITMADSPLTRTGETPPRVDKGHGIGSLGPSNTSDSGSDIVGGPGIGQADEFLPLDRGTNEDPAAGSGHAGNAADDVGDADMSADSDSSGTGERAAAGKDIATNRDRMPDHIEQVKQSDDVGPGPGGDQGTQQSGVESDAGAGTAGAGRDNSRTGRGAPSDPKRAK